MCVKINKLLTSNALNSPLGGSQVRVISVSVIWEALIPTIGSGSVKI